MKNMKFTEIIFQKLLVVIVASLGLLFSGAVYGQQDSDEPAKKDTVGVKLIVVGSNGNPIPNVQIIIGEGVLHAATDADGTAYFPASSSEIVTISAEGYDKEIVSVDQIMRDKTIQLKEAKLFLSDRDNVALPFMTVKKGHLTGSENVIAGYELSKYPSLDLRLAFSGLANGLEVGEKYGITGMSAEEKLGKYSAKEKVGMYMRGRSPIWIIDDVPTDITEMQLDPEEIESVTLLKDVVAKTMFGPQAADGAIYVKTKRGIKNERVLNVNFEYGVNTIDRMPEFVSGADYARLNNKARINSGLTPNYTDADIAAYEKNDPYDMRHPSINYRDYMLKNTKSFQRANISSRGGNENVQYFANLNYAGEGDIYKIGPAAGFNRITTRENVDIKVNDLVKIKFDFYGGLSFLKSNNYGSTKDDANANINSVLVQFDKVLDDITTISPIALPHHARAALPYRNQPGASTRCTTLPTPSRTAVEGITHSLCTLEFEVHRPLYDWVVDRMDEMGLLVVRNGHKIRPIQREFARLNLTYTIMSKRLLLQLVQEKRVDGWDDPRMPTICGLRRRGYTPEAIHDFCERIGVSKYNSETDVALLEYCLRDHLNKTATRRMAVLDPVKVVIDNYPEGREESFDAAEQPRRSVRRYTPRAVQPRDLHRARGLHGGFPSRSSSASRPARKYACATPACSGARTSRRMHPAGSPRSTAPTIPARAAAMRPTAAKSREPSTGFPCATRNRSRCGSTNACSPWQTRWVTRQDRSRTF